MTNLNTNPATGLDHDFDDPTFGTGWETLQNGPDLECDCCLGSGHGYQFSRRDGVVVCDGCLSGDVLHDTAVERDTFGDAI